MTCVSEDRRLSTDIISLRTLNMPKCEASYLILVFFGAVHISLREFMFHEKELHKQDLFEPNLGVEECSD